MTAAYVAFAILSACLLHSSFAAPIYVVHGSAEPDATCGAEASPCATLAAGIARAASGDEVRVVGRANGEAYGGVGNVNVDVQAVFDAVPAAVSSPLAIVGWDENTMAPAVGALYTAFELEDGDALLLAADSADISISGVLLRPTGAVPANDDPMSAAFADVIAVPANAVATIDSLVVADFGARSTPRVAVAGTASFTDVHSQGALVALDGAAVTISADTTFEAGVGVGNGATLDVAAGVASLCLSHLAGSAAVSVQRDATLTLRCAVVTGDGATSHIDNEGTIILDSSDGQTSFTIGSSLKSETTFSRIELDVAYAAPSGYEHITLTGDAALGEGNVAVRFPDEYEPVAGTLMEFIAAKSVTGANTTFIDSNVEFFNVESTSSLLAVQSGDFVDLSSDPFSTMYIALIAMGCFAVVGIIGAIILYKATV